MSEGNRKTAVITGASSGIGRAAAMELARQGWRIIGVGRDPQRCEQAEAHIQNAGGTGADVTMLRGDMSLLAQVDRLADEIIELTDEVHVLANNAGGMAAEARLTDEGLEANFTANHLAPFHLTERLQPLLCAAAQHSPPGTVRIINTSSDGSEMIPTLSVENMGKMEELPPGAIYCSGKLANVLHARGLGGQLAERSIIAHSFHPGTVGSNFFEHVSDDVRSRYKDVPKLTSEQGADTLVWLATSDEAAQSTGLYWHERKLRDPNPVVEDESLIERLWDKSRQLINDALEKVAAR